MELHQLRYLLAVVDEGSFTAAAERLHVSQSGVSAQLAKFERELGQQLLERTGKRVVLTPCGKAVLPMARDILATSDAITHTAAEFADALRGRVRLGAITGCAIPGFLDAIADLGKAHPGITLQLTEADSRTLEAQLLDRTLDLALIGYAGAISSELTLHPISAQQLVAVAAPGAEFARESVRLAELQDAPVLCLPTGSGIRAAYELSCEKVGLEARTDVEASSPQTLLGLAERGAGFAVLPASSAASGPHITMPIEDADVPACLGLISTHAPASPAVRLVLDKLGAALSGSGSAPFGGDDGSLTRMGAADQGA